jgi:hypothetical protein
MKVSMAAARYRDVTDAQGKTFSTALLRMQVEISDAEARSLGLV